MSGVMCLSSVNIVILSLHISLHCILCRLFAIVPSMFRWWMLPFRCFRTIAPLSRREISADSATAARQESAPPPTFAGTACPSSRVSPPVLPNAPSTAPPAASLVPAPLPRLDSDESGPVASPPPSFSGSPPPPFVLPIVLPTFAAFAAFVDDP